MHMDVSDIARVRRQIVEEMEAMERGFRSFASGTARHDFIQARMRNIGAQQEDLEKLVGKSSAVNMVCELYINTVKGSSHQTG
ncbi:MAG: hypothetical protein M3Y39_22795 [Chloroflexota bacterium]|nr:hypothetical protein [Chloroflexota bacterium]